VGVTAIAVPPDVAAALPADEVGSTLYLTHLISPSGVTEGGPAYIYIYIYIIYIYIKISGLGCTAIAVPPDVAAALPAEEDSCICTISISFGLENTT